MHGRISYTRVMERVVCLRAKSFDALIGRCSCENFLSRHEPAPLVWVAASRVSPISDEKVRCDYPVGRQIRRANSSRSIHRNHGQIEADSEEG